jgi:arrestin-related trafficking adapter 9
MSRKGSLFSKIATPFASRSRNVSEFIIKLDDPWKSYFPGEVVKGSVVVTVIKPFRITHLTICLHGFVKVYKHAITQGDGLIGQGGFLGPGRGRRGGEYLGNGFASLFEDEAVLCGEGRLPEGVYEFKFELEFPKQLPSSVDVCLPLL